MPVSGRSWDVAAPGPSRPLLSVMLSYAGTGVRGAGALLASTSRGDTRTVARIIEDTSGLVSIGQLALDAGVSSRTIRYYEELGIIPEPHRSAGGTRKYPREFRGYIEPALVLKDLGFRLEEIKPLARLALGRPVSAGQRDAAQRLVEDRIEALDQQMTGLRRLHESVQRPSSVTALAGVLGRRAPAMASATPDTAS